MPTDPNTGETMGIAHLTFKDPENAKAAQEGIHGLELVGRKLSVALVADMPPAAPPPMVAPPVLPNMLPNLMGLGGGPAVPGMPPMPPGMMPLPGMVPGMVPGMGVPPMVVPGMPGLPGMMPMPDPAAGGGVAPPGPPSKVVLLKNMFDPNGSDERNDPDFFEDLTEDVTDEVRKHGEVIGCVALPESQGYLYLQFGEEEAAARCVGALNGRWFAGKQVQAATVEESEMPPPKPSKPKDAD